MTAEGNKTSVKVEKEEKFVAVPDGRIAYVIEDTSNGKGEVVLCLPSMGDIRREFERFAPELVKAGYRVITTELRGNGGSTGHFKSFNLPDLCNDITAILDAEKVEKVIIIGCSISGASAGLYAIEHPERISRMVLINPIMHGGKRLTMTVMGALMRTPVVGKMMWLSYFKTLYPSRPVEADYLADLKVSASQPGASKSLAGMGLAPRLDNQLQDIKVPALIFFGSKDPDFKDVRSEAAILNGKIAGSKVVMLEGLGHYPHHEKPETVLPQTLEWLAEHK